MSWGPFCVMNPQPGRPSVRTTLDQLQRGGRDLRDEMAPAPGRQLWPPAAARLNTAAGRASHGAAGSRAGGGAAAGAWSPSAHHGGEAAAMQGASTPPPHAHAPPCRASGTVTGAAAAARSPTPLTGCSEFSVQTPPSRWRLPPPATPITVPCSRRRGAAILSPSLPPSMSSHSENRPGRPAAFTSPAAFASLPGLTPQDAPGRPRHRPGAPRPSPGPPGNPPQRPPVRGRLRRRSRQPGSSPGLTAASLGPARPRATPPGLARKRAPRGPPTRPTGPGPCAQARPYGRGGAGTHRTGVRAVGGGGGCCRPKRRPFSGALGGLRLVGRAEGGRRGGDSGADKKRPSSGTGRRQHVTSPREKPRRSRKV